jgi:AcrR family transcriptional regulator
MQPAPLPTRERQRLETRSLILEVALAEIAEAGLAGARIEHIARKAGVTRPTIYAHFPRKEDFLLSLQAQTEEVTLRALEARLEGAVTVADLLRRMVGAIFELLGTGHPVLRREVFALIIREPQEADWIGNGLFGFVSERIRLDHHASRFDLVFRPGSSPDQFNKPTDVAFGPSGDVFVADGYGNSRVIKFDHRGKFLSEWGTAGSQPGEFDLPHSIVVDSRQRVLVGDRENDRIQVFDLNGRRLEIWNGFAPYGIAIDSSHRVFIADGRANQILRLNPAGQVELRLGSKGHATGQFELPHMLAVDRDGSLYVAEVGGRRFQKFRLVK